MNRPVTQQMEVQIMGQSYLLACPVGGEAALLEAVERVDTAMCRIRDAGKVKARDRIAVLASLNLAFELSQRASHTAEAQGSAEAALAVAAPAAPGGSCVEPRPDPQVLARLDDLIRRLDQALDSDGQLL